MSVSAISEKLVIHGQQLTLDLPDRTKRLEFISADESEKNIIWEDKILSFRPSKPSKGEVSSASNGMDVQNQTCYV